MDRSGIGILGAGLVLCIIGIYAIWIFLPEVIAAVKGLVGIAVLMAGLMLAVFGFLICKD